MNHVKLFTYNAFNSFRWPNANAGTVVRPQLCSDKRFNFCNPVNALTSIFDIELPDSTLETDLYIIYC